MDGNFIEKIKQAADTCIKQGYKSLCIIHPALNVGGGSFVYKKILERLEKETNLNLYYMDYPNGYISQEFKNVGSRVHCLPYNPDTEHFPISEKCIVVCNSTRIVMLPKMNKKNKILLWHYETIPCTWNVVLLDNEAKKYLKLCKKNNAMCYIDWASRDVLNRYWNVGFKNKDYIFCSIPEKQFKPQYKLCQKNTLNVGWIGRLAHDKIQSIFYIIENLAQYKTDKKIRFHIVGTGLCDNMVRQFCQKYKNIEFIFTGTIQRENLDDYILNNIDLLFAMGASVLEGASLKIPSAVVLEDTKPIADKDAFWLFDTKEYCVGVLKEQKKDFKIKYTSISDMLSVVDSDEGKKLIGERCYDYYLKHFSNFDEVVFNFLSFCSKTTLTAKKLKKCIMYMPYNSIKEVKIWSLFGKKILTITKLANKIIYKSFGFRWLKIKIDKNRPVYRLCGLKFTTKMSKPYTFPSALINDAKVSNAKLGESK